MLYKISSVISKFAENLTSTLPSLGGTSKPIVFLGGDCSEDWREPLKKQYKEKFLLLDPADDTWEPEKNIYAEIEALLKSDHIIFYKGGKGTLREKNLLKGLGINNYKNFGNVEDLKEYLDSL
jgi:hypothetical protein